MMDNLLDLDATEKPKDKDSGIEVEFTFMVDRFMEDKPRMNVKVLNIKASSGLSMSDYSSLADEIENYSFEKDEISGLDISTLSDEVTYKAKGKLTIDTVQSGWEYVEYDVYMSLDISSYEEEDRFGRADEILNYTGRQYLETMSTDRQNSVKIKELSKNKLLIEAEFNLVRHMMIVSVDDLVDMLTKGK